MLIGGPVYMSSVATTDFIDADVLKKVVCDFGVPASDMSKAIVYAIDSCSRVSCTADYSNKADTMVYATHPRVDQKLISFTCPCCGTHYIAGDPGFIPNCHNCGAVMRKD